MNKLDLHIQGFKCFVDKHVELNKLTLLTGANASGKSSVIQSLLLLKAASESEATKKELNLDNSQYAFDFGHPDSLINNELLTDEVALSIEGVGGLVFRGEEQPQSRKLQVNTNHSKELTSLFETGFTYLCAERQGPRYEYAKSAGESKNCGCHGENTGNVVSDNWSKKVAGAKLLNPVAEEALFNIALDKWVDYIFPGVVVRIQPAGSQTYQVIIRDSYHNFPTDSTNIGFGISYALPILVGALLAKEGSWLVVENPEAHIHAKAQSNMGFFLGMMAAAGLRVIIETHSEHVVNGVRRAAVIGGRLCSEDVNIYFFKGKSESTLISIDDYGNLSDFPVDFFDQSRQDMMEIIKKTRGNEKG